MWQRLTHSTLFLDQTDFPLEIERAQIEQFYHPLATGLLAAASVPRLMVAVAGPPGSGKTAFATTLVAVINAETDSNTAALVGLDGWHYANDYLSAHFVERGGGRVSLQSIKGAPETFDVAAAYNCLSRIRQGGRVSFPVYSRRLHEPVPDGGTVDPSHRIVVVEGNYLLLDETPWRRLHPLFDVRVFISASPNALVNALRERHLRGAKTVAATERQIREVDLPNGARVASGIARAQVLVYKHETGVRRIDRVEGIDSL